MINQGNNIKGISKNLPYLCGNIINASFLYSVWKAK